MLKDSGSADNHVILVPCLCRRIQFSSCIWKDHMSELCNSGFLFAFLENQKCKNYEKMWISL